MAILEYNEEASQRLLAVYTTPDVERQRLEFLNAISLNVGEKVLDVGSGPGFLAKIMAEKVKPNGSIYGVDVSEFLLNIARSNTSENEELKFLYGDATDLPFPNEFFDTVVCAQVLEYVNDIDKALREIQRVVRKDGKIALLDTDWDSIVWHSSDQDRMSRILKAWEAHATDPFLPRTLADRMTKAGLKVISIQIIPILNPEFDPNTYSNRMIDLIVPFILGQNKINREEVNDWVSELRNPESYFFSLNRYLFLGTKP
jgi:ubiquinone/menaquinone biosynthesis C-methylase UbiE